MDRGCQQKLLWKTFVNIFSLAHVISANIKGEELAGHTAAIHQGAPQCPLLDSLEELLIFLGRWPC